MEPFAIKRTGDDDYPKHIKALLLGPPKSGKTTFLSTFPNPIVADVEAGLMSIAHKDIPHITVDHSSKLDTLLMVLRDDGLRKKAAADSGRPDFETVGIDTLDALQELYKKERMRDERRQSFERNDWGWLLEQFQEKIRAFVALPMHVVFTVHTTTTQDDEGRIITMPGLQGAIKDQIAGMVGFSLKSDRVVEIDQQTGAKRSHYTIQTEGDERNPHLGNRAAGRLPRSIEPDFQVLYDAVYQNVQLAQAQRVEVQTSVQSNPAEAAAAAAAPAAAPAPEDTSTPPPAPAATEEVAQTSGQSEQPAGAPSDDAESTPINASALQHLSKMASEFGVDLAPAVKDWTLEQGRDVARYVVACKTDAANGDSDQDELRETVVEGLIGMGAATATSGGDPVPAGTVDDVLGWAGKSPEHAQVALQHEEAKGEDGRSTLKNKLKTLVSNASEESGQASEQGTTSTDEAPGEPEAQKADDKGTPPDAESPQAEDQTPEAPEEQPEPPTAEQAEELIKSELGGQEIPPEELPKEQRPCEVCGKSKESDPDDFDLDIANLSQVRFKKWLCVSDYMALVQQGKAAS